MAEYDFNGQYDHAIDQKSRMFIPSECRLDLGAEFVLCIPLGAKDYMVIYPMEEWERYFSSFKEFCSGRELAAAERVACNNKKNVAMDKQGRITIPQNFLDKVGIGKEAHLVGIHNRIEVWDSEKWHEFNDEFDAENLDWLDKVVI